VSALPSYEPESSVPADLTEALEAFRVHALTFRRLRARTVHTYLWHLRRLLIALPPGAHTGAITPEALRNRLQTEEARGISAHTLRVQCFALGTYYRWLTHTGYTGPCPLDEIRAPRRPATEREDYAPAEADAILRLAREAAMRPDATRREQFDYAVLAVLRYAGLRRGEVIVLRLDDLDLERRRVRVDGKGGRVRTVPLLPVLVEVLQWYLDDVRPFLPASEMLFANPNAQRQPYMGITCEKVIERITHRYGNAAEVECPHMPHRWRHPYATQLLRSGVDIHKVQKLLGHADLRTTVIYLHLLVDDLHDSVDKAFG